MVVAKQGGELQVKQIITWFPNPIPTPSMIRPNRSIAILAAAAFRVAPTRKLIPPQIILARRPYFLVIGDATKDATRPAKYREEVNAASPWLSYLQ